MANILMERMPPSGWSDVARKQDITNIHKELTGINGTLKVIIGGVLTVSAAIIVLLIQLNHIYAADTRAFFVTKDAIFRT